MSEIVKKSNVKSEMRVSYVGIFGQCKRENIAIFPGPSLSNGVGYECSLNGLQCSALHCPKMPKDVSPRSMAKKK